MKKVLIAGGSGLVGKNLTNHLLEKGYEVKILTRRKSLINGHDNFLHWDIDKEIFELNDFHPNHGINLSGVGIADKRWSKKRKKEIINSRIRSLQFLKKNLESSNIHLQSFIGASAIGYYGNTNNLTVSEDSSPANKDFLSEVCTRWEECSNTLSSISKSHFIVRIGTVLSGNGGALKEMTKTIPFGMANYLGDGKQSMSWIHIDDLSRLFIHLLESENTSSVYNATAPEVVSNYQFTKQLRDTLNPRAIMTPVPALALQLLLGEMSDLVLNSNRVDSEKIRSEGFSFNYPTLQKALEQIFTRN